MPKINKIRVDGIDYDIEGTVGKQNTEGSSGEIFNDYINNKATADYSSASGKNTKSTNEAEAAFGKYNISNPSDIFTIGIGSSDVERKNAIEVNNQGDVFIIGIGGYDGVTTKDKKHLKQILDNIASGTGVVAEKLGTETKGSNVKFIYLNEGKPVESNANLGSTSRPVYIKNGEFTACDDKFNNIINIADSIVGVTNVIKTDGEGNKFLADDGTYKTVESGGGTGTVAEQLGTETKGSNVKFIYLNEGRPVESNANLGSTSRPVYINNGEFTACDDKFNNVVDVIKTDGGGDKFLADDGTYKTVDEMGPIEAEFVKRDRGNNKVTSLTNLPITKSLVIATLSNATNISLSSNMEIGDSLTVMCFPTSDFSQPIPNSGSYISLDGESINAKRGGYFEINIYCYDTNKYSLSSKIKK